MRYHPYARDLIIKPAAQRSADAPTQRPARPQERGKSVTFKLVARGDGDLKTRYRPRRMDEICPTFPVLDALSILNELGSSKVWLFEGLTGSGKTTLARIISRMSVCEAEPEQRPCLQCEPCQTMEDNPDFLEINSAKCRGIDEMREITNGMRTLPNWFKKKIYIFDEAQQITPAAQELLNKELEEPYDHVMIFLCTTHKKGLKRTLLGRCAKITFQRMSRKQCGSIISQICKEVGNELPDNETTEDMFRRADGSVRDLLVLLDSFLRGSYKIGTGSGEEEISTGSPNIFALVKGLIEKDWPTVRDILSTENVKNDPDGYRETVCEFLARDALNPKWNEPKMSIAQTLNILAGSTWEEPKREQHSILVMRCMKACVRK